MRDVMDWGFCKAKFIKAVEADPEKADSIIESAKLRLEYVKGRDANKDNVSFIIEGYYEVIKELLVALLLYKGLRSGNHQCLISYFYKTYPEYGAEGNLISQMSYLRNRLDYYGEKIDFAFYDKNKEEFNNIIHLLIELNEKR